MGIISPRDFVDVIFVKKYEDGTISSNGVFLIYAVSAIGTVTSHPEPQQGAQHIWLRGTE